MTVYAEHALLQSALARLRAQATSHAAFAKTLTEIGTILCALVSADIETQRISIRTPLARAKGVAQKNSIVLVPILRAGLGLLPSFTQLLPDAPVGHVGVERDHATLAPKFYYYKVPPLKGQEVWLLDPMLATGGSLDFALEKIKHEAPKKIRAVCVIAAPEGVARIRKAHGDVFLHIAALDQKLDKRGYIVPGLGDAGDRFFGT
ncbi:MAG: uracil phosphoribosyltransferase [Spirochaetes bacterium]|nr:uracil phosphoribosyltransferase [Spirochaetota bacterium]